MVLTIHVVVLTMAMNPLVVVLNIVCVIYSLLLVPYDRFVTNKERSIIINIFSYEQNSGKGRKGSQDFVRKKGGRGVKML